MALFVKIVLLTLVSSEISLGQRKHGRTFPVAADVKPGLNFDCPEEFGYYPHPNDCTQYYVCVFGGALLESCTGGLMYSHELQTCDWPRNVGCDGVAEAVTTPSTYSSSPSSRVQESKVRYTHPPPPPPPAQPAAVVTSRGQPRQLQHNQQELIKQKQQQQLYDEADDALPPAEEIENDRQQRVYRGQPSTIGQVQKDRDGLRHHTNAIPSPSNGVEKIGVISFGSQQQSLQDYRNLTDDIDNFLKNDLTFKRRKRQIKQSHHRFETNIRQPIFPYQLPLSINTRPYSASYSNNNKLNSYQNQYDRIPADQVHNYENTSQYTPYSKVNFSLNISATSNVLNNSTNQQDSSHSSFSYRDKPNFSIFNPSTRFPLQIPDHQHPFRLNISYNIKATPNSIDHHNFSPTTEFKTLINKYKPAMSQHRPVIRTHEPNHEQLIRLHNYHPSESNIKELKELIDALTNFRNLQLFLRESQNLDKKQLINTTPKSINIINTTSKTNYFHDKIPLPDKYKTKANETVNRQITKTLEETTQSNIENINKTTPNDTHTDDAYYYYDEDAEDEILKDTKTVNETFKYIPLIYNETKTDLKLITSTQKQILFETTTQKINQPSKFPTHPNYHPTMVRIAGKLPPSFTGHTPLRMPLPNTRHNIDNYRHRPLTPNINWSKYNNHSSNYSPYSNNMPKRVESQSNRPTDQGSYSTVRSKPVYNNSQPYDSRYDPYYDLYEELDPELYKSVEYTQHYNNDPPTSQQTYRSSTAPTATQILIQEKIPKRGNSGYNQNSYSTQDTYRPSSISSYEKDERYNNNQDDGQGIYQQTNKQSSRRDQNELNFIEEPTSTKRIATFKTTVSTPRQVSSIKNTKTLSSAESHEVQGTFPNYKLQRNSEYIHTTHTPNDTQIASDINRPYSILLDVNLTPPQKNVLRKPFPFALPLDAVTPLSFHYVTKSSKSTSVVSTDPISKNQSTSCNYINCEVIVPTTYSPSTSPFKYFMNAQELPSVVENLKSDKTSTVSIAKEVVKSEKIIDDNKTVESFQITTAAIVEFSDKVLASDLDKPKSDTTNSTLYLYENLNYLNSNDIINENIENSTPKQLETSLRPNPTKSVTKKTNTLSYHPTRVSRVNMAIKSIVSFGGPPRQYTKCSNNQTPNDKCKPVKKRVNNRGRGSSHYSNSGPADEGAVVNRGTPPPRSRPTLKPSTSIVSKASEFIDIYKNPPRRPDTIYPQPQPDKTAAKCRKDVCLLPDCSCGGKEIPGDLDVSQVPQMVLLTFDDAVNDLNMGYYSELFERGRVNPNGCPIVSTFYVSHEWTDYSQVQNLYADGHEMASHTVSHSFGEQFSQKKWTKEIAGQREILSAYGGVRLEDVRGMRAPFLSVGGNKMFKMLYDSNFTYDSSMPIYENKPPSWPYTLDYKLFHDCMIPPCPTRSYPGVWEVPMVMWQDLNGGRCSMGDACSNPSDADGVFKMIMKNFERHYTTNRAPFGLFYHAAWFTQPHHKEGFIHFLDTINTMDDVWLLTNWQAIQWVRDPTPISRLSSFQPFGCNYPERPKRCNNPKVCNLWHKTGVRYMRTCQPCPDIYPWTGNTGIRSSRIDNEIGD